MSNCRRIMQCNGLASGPFFTRHITFSKHLVNILPNVFLSISVHYTLCFFGQILSTGSCCIKRVWIRDSRSQSVSALYKVVLTVCQYWERHGSRNFSLVVWGIVIRRGIYSIVYCCRKKGKNNEKLNLFNTDLV